MRRTISVICQCYVPYCFQSTDKEYCILIATLIYNIDRLANTVGHFDAYIKKPIKYQPLRLRMIEAEAYDNIEIFKQDANVLAGELNADVAYIDPSL